MVNRNSTAALLLSLIPAFSIHAQETVKEGDINKLPPSSLLQEKVRQWVDIQKQRSKESSRWQEQKQGLAGLNEIRNKEINQIDKLIAAAGKRLEQATRQRQELQEEQAALQNARALFQQHIDKLESGLRDCLPRFPGPLREKVSDAISRLEKADPDRPLQNRYRDLLAILAAAAEFDNSITVTKEMRQVGGEKVELETLYLGLSKAWYVGRSDTVAGQGKAGNKGWQWTENNSIAQPVRQAIEIYHKKRTPDYVKLPF